MSGHGKSLGKGKGGAKRFRFARADATGPQGAMNKPSIKRLARRGGVKRLTSGIYDVTRQHMLAFLERVLHDTIIFAEHARRKTIQPLEDVHALRRSGVTLYGFGTDAALAPGSHSHAHARARPRSSSSPSHSRSRSASHHSDHSQSQSQSQSRVKSGHAVWAENEVLGAATAERLIARADEEVEPGRVKDKKWAAVKAACELASAAAPLSTEDVN